MDRAYLKQFVEARPFKPFRIVLPSDREIPVPHPEFISISPTSSAAVVWHRNGVGEHIDFRWIVSIKPNKDSAGRD